MDTRYAKHYPKSGRDFFDLFDPLPYRLKAMVEYDGKAPSEEDVILLWKLLEEETGDSINTLKKDIIKRFFPEVHEKNLEMERRKKEFERNQKRLEKYNKWRNIRNRIVYETVEVRPKDLRLVERVTEEELAKRLTKRVENKEIKPMTYTTWTTEEKKKREIKGFNYDELPEKPEPKSSVFKTLHNSHKG